MQERGIRRCLFCSTSQCSGTPIRTLRSVDTLAHWLKVKRVKLPFANSNWLDVLYSVGKTLSLISQAASKPVRQVFCNYTKNGFGSSGVLATLERQKRCLCVLIWACVSKNRETVTLKRDFERLVCVQTWVVISFCLPVLSLLEGSPRTLIICQCFVDVK